MNFRTFDVLFAAVIVLAVVSAISGFYLESPYPPVVVAAFSGGAAVFLYLTVRVKIAGIMGIVDKRLLEQEATIIRYREAIDKSFADIEKLARATHEQFTAISEKNAADVAALQYNVNAALTQNNANVEKAVQTALALQHNFDAANAAFEGRLGAAESALTTAAEASQRLAGDFNGFVADERSFRKKIEDHLSDRVAYLEDFIREKRKSLQI